MRHVETGKSISKETKTRSIKVALMNFNDAFCFASGVTQILAACDGNRKDYQRCEKCGNFQETTFKDEKNLWKLWRSDVQRNFPLRNELSLEKLFAKENLKKTSWRVHLIVQLLQLRSKKHHLQVAGTCRRFKLLSNKEKNNLKEKIGAASLMQAATKLDWNDFKHLWNFGNWVTLSVVFINVYDKNWTF